MKLVYSPRSLRDVDEILTYVRDRSAQGAHNVSVAIERTIESIAANPYIGTSTDEPQVYRFPLSRYRYTLFYRVDEPRGVVEIIRVVQGARVRDLGKLPGDS